jgi:DNA-binding LacI/PurR family transcriptional regulator
MDDAASGGNGRHGGRLTTMRDIAREAGVSQSTVSRVLNDAPTRVPIAPETRERVTLAARRLGYRPNPLARGLRGAPTMLIGAVVRDITDPFFAGAIEALSVEAMARGYNVVLGHAHSRADEALALTAVLETRHCDAIVLLGDVQDQPRLLGDLKDSLVPVVALWQGSSALGVPTIDVDNRAGVRAAVNHVADLGHERIAFVSGRPLGDIREREAAFNDSMTERFGGVRDGYLQHVSNTPAGGATALGVLLHLADPPTAVVASTDTLAFGVLHAANALGRRVPDDLSVVGFDDILLASHTVPALTTLRMPAREIVAEGLDIAIELARNPGHRPERTVRVIAPELIVRQSTAPPPGA